VKDQRPKSAKRESVKRSITPKKEVESRSLRSRSKTQAFEKKSEKPASVEKRVSRSKDIPRELVEKKVVQPEKKLESLEKHSVKPEQKSIDRKSVKLEPKLTKSLTRESVVKESKPSSVIKTALVSVKPGEKKIESFDFKSKSHNASKRASAKPTPIPHHRSKTPLRSSNTKQ